MSAAISGKVLSGGRDLGLARKAWQEGSQMVRREADVSCADEKRGCYRGRRTPAQSLGCATADQSSGARPRRVLAAEPTHSPARLSAAEAAGTAPAARTSVSARVARMRACRPHRKHFRAWLWASSATSAMTKLLWVMGLSLANKKRVKVKESAGAVSIGKADGQKYFPR